MSSRYTVTFVAFCKQRKINVSSNKETVLAQTLTQLLLMLTSLSVGLVPVLDEALADVQEDSPPAVLVTRTRGVSARN